MIHKGDAVVVVLTLASFCSLDLFLLLHSSPGITITEACLPLKAGTMWFRKLTSPPCTVPTTGSTLQMQANVESLEFFGHLKHQESEEGYGNWMRAAEIQDGKEEMSSQRRL